MAIDVLVVNEDFNNTDVGNGNRLAARFKSVLRWIPKWHTWVHYDGIRWDKVSEDEVTGLGKIVLSEMKDEARELEKDISTEAKGHALGSWAYASEKGYHLDRMVQYAKPDLIAQPEDFDQGPFLNALDCTIDMTTGFTHPHNSGDMLTKVTNVEYNRASDGTRWFRFIDEITGGDIGLAEYIQMVLGLSLTTVLEKHVWFAQGGGDNGKSVLFEITGDAMGDYADVGTTTDIVSKGNGTAKPWSIVKLAGARRATFSELEPGDKLNWTIIKQMTGGDTMSVEEKFKQPLSVRMSAKVFIPTNDLPTVDQVGDAEWGRIRVIPFRECFIDNRVDCHKPDKYLMEKLRAELPAILRWLVGGEVLRQELGLVEPDTVVEATQKFQADNDTFADFLRECTFKDNSARTKLKDIVSAYQQWFDGDSWAIPKDSEIGKQMVGHKFQRKTIRGVSHYVGIAIKPEWQGPQTSQGRAFHDAYDDFDDEPQKSPVQVRVAG